MNSTTVMESTTQIPHHSPPNGISVLVSGAGVGGLMAALECWRQGCNVRVFERSAQNITVGDSFGIGVSGINALRNWPQMQAENEVIAYKPLLCYCDATGKRICEPFELTEMVSDDLADTTTFYRHIRPKFHHMLYRQLQAIGLEIEFNKRVVDYFEENTQSAGVVLQDGSKVEADLVIAADGVRGTSQHIVSGVVPARSSGSSIWRFAYPVEAALADPMIAERFPLLADGRSLVEIWVGPTVTAVIWRTQDVFCCTINRPDDGTAKESWSHKSTAEEVLKFTATLPEWPEVANRIVKAAPAGVIVDWKLMWRDPQPNWTSAGGRVIQLGDAAHTFLPSSGNGATQAIEDAVSLAACLKVAGKQAIPSATRVHNLLRFERVSCLQAFGVANKARHTSKKQHASGKPNIIHISKWILNHDPEEYVYSNYNQALAHLEGIAAFKNTNIPPGIEYIPWTIDTLLQAQENGDATVLDGDWE